MTEIDPYSMKLGAIEEGLRNVSRQYAVIDNKLEKLIEKLIDSIPLINERAKRAHARIDEILHPETGLLTEAAANAAQAQETLQKGKWVLMGVGASSLLGGTVFGSWLNKISALFSGVSPGP